MNDKAPGANAPKPFEQQCKELFPDGYITLFQLVTGVKDNLIFTSSQNDYVELQTEQRMRNIVQALDQQARTWRRAHESRTNQKRRAEIRKAAAAAKKADRA